MMEAKTDGSTSQEMLRITGNYQKPGRDKEESSPRVSKVNVVLPTP